MKDALKRPSETVNLSHLGASLQFFWDVATALRRGYLITKQPEQTGVI